MRFSKVMMFLALLASTATVFGQGVTTASMSGVVTDNNGDGLPGAVVNATHEPTGTRYTAVTRANGAYRIFNARVGGPYTVTATMTGFKTQQAENIFLKLGEDRRVDFTMQLDSVEETLTVVADTGAIINPSRTGAVSNVSEETIQELPSINRSFEDFARTNPYFNVTSSNDGAGAISVAGRSNRYNNIQIDGAVNNDLFGLSASGAPGGQAEAPFISLDAIQEIQLLLSPYDVRQGGFSGGGINAITRSGSNTFEGSVYHFWRNDSMIGDGPTDSEFGDFDETQTGFRVGGPIVKDRAFFFVSVEQRRSETPSGWALRPAGQSGGGLNFGDGADFDSANQFRDFLISEYGYDPGGLDQVTRDRDSDTIFARMDFNLNENHQLTVRHNYVDAENLRTGNSNFAFQFPSNHQFFPSETNSTVVQLNSTFSGDIYNEFRVAFTSVKDRRRGVDSGFPWIEIENLPNGNGEFEAGTERFSTANSLDQDVIEITNDVTIFRGNHTIVLGTHNELFEFDNLFIRENFGAYEFRTLDDFFNGRVRRFNYSFSSDPNDPLRSAKFDVRQLGFYASDQWAVTPDFNLTFGIRADIPDFPDTPTANPLAEEVFGLRTDVTADNAMITPRVGFNWDIDGDGTSQLRGGIGLFAGRLPFVWYSNQYSNTGIEFSRFSYTATDLDGDGEIDYYPFSPDADGQFDNLLNFVNEFGGDLSPSSGNEINLVDPDFEMPQLLRFSLGYDRELGFGGLIGSVEFIHSESQEEILYQNINFVESGDTLFDGRPIMTRVDTRLRDVIFLTNTDQGSQTNASIKIERPKQDGLAYSASYAWGESESVNDGTSSQARSNWRFNNVQGNPNESNLGRSAFEVEHRINLSLSYTFGFDAAPTTIAFFYDAQSGRPFSTTFRNDVNGDGETNDLLYVPASRDEVIVVDRSGNDAWETFNAYINADNGLSGARGSIVERNASNAPWRRNLDFRLTQDVNVRSYKFQLTLDVLNVMNLLDSDEGVIEYASFNEVSPIQYLGEDADTGRPIYEVRIDDPADRFTIDNRRSRYQLQLGARFSF